jgi:peptidoglycan/LPS O-acetylase OafA/YrhL
VTSTLDRPVAPTLAPSGSSKKNFRPDIQGLRAIGVIAVVLDHLIGWPSGGFVSVDMFFVISGFLITGLLLREHERTNHISFRDFYKRRIRRIVPAAVLTLVVTVAASYLVFTPARANGILGDAFWSLFMGQNWHLAVIGTDYFQADGLITPLRHYWSLAVEEQFYFVWPWLLLLIFAVGSRFFGWGSQRLRVAAAVAITVISIASFGWALWESANNPTVAYFSTFSRAWELGLGALIAVLAKPLERIPAALRPVIAWVGLTAFVVSLFTTSETTGFPAPWAALPVVATALVIAANDQRTLVPLTNRVSGYIGNLSYSLYLVHFPIIIILGALMPPSPVYYITALALMVYAAIGSYELVEEPIRSSSWLDPSARRKLPKAAPGRRPVGLTRWKTTFAVWSVATVVVIITAAIWSSSPQNASATGSTITFTETPLETSAPPTDAATEAPVAAGPAAELSAAITAALAAPTFPDLKPSVDELGTAAWVRQVQKDGCADIGPDNEQSCVSGSTKTGKSVAVFGDSFAMAWLPAIEKALPGWSIHPYTRGQCPSMLVSVTQDGSAPFPECDAHQQWAVGAINDLKPDLIILANATYDDSKFADAAKGSAAIDEITTGYVDAVDALNASGAKIAILEAPSDVTPLQECYTRFAAPSDCVSTTSETWQDSVDATAAAATESGAAYVETAPWFCSEDGECPGFVGTTPVRADAGHMTVQYARELGPVLADALTPLVS